MFQKPRGADLKVLLFRCASSLIQLGLHLLNYQLSVWVLLPFSPEHEASTSKNTNIYVCISIFHARIHIYEQKVIFYENI